MDAITLLKADHRAVNQLFRQFKQSGGRAHAQRRKIVDKVIEELSVHAAIEEQLFYPAVRKLVEDQEELVLESLEEHHIVKWVLSELQDLEPDDERFEAKMKVLTELVRDHVEEEESKLFPSVRQVVGRKKLSEIGGAMEQAKKTAPKRPHPRSPDTPPGNIVAGAVAGAVDKLREKVSSHS